jgi:hypothetical protein
LAKYHRQEEYEKCSCKHGCLRCVPAQVRDSTGFLFRLAVANKDAVALGQALTSTDIFPDSLLPDLAIARARFLNAALETLGTEERATFTKDVLKGVGMETMETPRSMSARPVLELLEES